MSKADSLHSILSRTYAPVRALADRSELTLKEAHTQYCLRFPGRRPCVCYRVDGDIIRQGLKCDFLVLASKTDGIGGEQWQSVFVELKGTDVGHAIDQLEATLKHPVFSHPGTGERHARVVGKSFPASKNNPRFELAKRNFKTRYKCSLKQISSGKPDLLE